MQTIASPDLRPRPVGRPPYWNEERVRAVLDGYVARLGRAPHKRELETGGHAGVATWLARNVGPQAEIAAWLGADHTARRRYGSRAEVVAAIAPLAARLGRMPTQRELNANGLSGVTRATQRIGGGLTAIAHELGLEANVPTDPRRRGTQSCVCGRTHRGLVSENCYAVRCGRIGIEELRTLLERRAAGALDDRTWIAFREAMGIPGLEAR